MDAKLIQEYPPAILEDEEYFQWYEKDFEWYFDPNCCRFVGFQDYQRLVLRDDVRNFTPCNYVSVHYLSCTTIFCGHTTLIWDYRAFGRV